MMRAAVRATLVSLALGVAALAVAGSANASQVLVDVSAPQQATVGEAVEISATLRSADDGLPLVDTPVVFSTRGSFGGVSGDIQLGRAVTDERGVATLRYQPRSAGDREIRVEYLAPGESEPQVASATISVADASQLHQPTAGVQIPGLNVWLIIAVITAVWAILFFVALRTAAIAGAGVETSHQHGASP